MRRTPFPYVRLVVLAAAVALTGCGDRGAASSGSHYARRRSDTARMSRIPPTGSLRYPSVITVDDGSLPDLKSSDLSLPPGSEVTDYTERIASYARRGVDSGHAVLGLLDLSSGKHRDAMREGMNEKLGYSVAGPRLSDSWIAWEEVSPNEGAEPGKATWQLCAAALDRKSLSVRDARRVERAVTNYQLRPHYAVIGDTLYWTANHVAGEGQERFPRWATIEALELDSGRRRTLRRSNTTYETLCGAGGLLSVTERVSAGDGAHVRALLLDPVTGEVELSLDLANDSPVAHFVRASLEHVAWAVLGTGAEWPNLYLAARGARGRANDAEADETPVLPARAPSVQMVGVDSIDPVFFGRYLAFESVGLSGSPAGGSPGRVRRVWIADPQRNMRSVLIETRDRAGEGWWQTCASSAASKTLLLWNDLGPWSEDASNAKTLIRIVRAPD